MSITYSGDIISNVRCAGVHLQEAIGHYLLGFSLHFDVQAWPEQEHRFENASAKVFAGAPQSSLALLGHAFPESSVLIRTSRHTSSPRWLFELPLFPAQLAALERIRNGGDLQFKLNVYGESFGPGQPLPAQDDISVAVTQSEWIKLLRQAKVADILLLEFPLPLNCTNGALRTAVEHLGRARDFLLAGHYDEAVGKCRLSLEAITKSLGQEQRQSEAVATFNQRRREMSAEERLLLLREASKHYTQLAHHDLTIESASQYSRADAVAIVGVTAALLAHAYGASVPGQS